VFAPNGTLPLYNVLVFVPNEPLQPIAQGLTCDRCGGAPPGKPVAATLTDSHGHFVLADVPVGRNIPLVMQTGKWRRQIQIPNVVACKENELTDPDQTRLPAKRSEGDMPRIALATGGCDNLVCLFPKLGIDPSEIGIAGDDKAVTFYHGSPAIRDSVDRMRYDPHVQQMTEAQTLWGNLDELKKYDIAMFSCECEEDAKNKDAASYKAVTDYLNAGGRVFGTDFQYVWYKNTPDPALRGVTTVRGGANSAGNPVTLDTSFPKGKALSEWLTFTQATKTPGEVSCSLVFDNFTGVTTPAAQVWGTSGMDPSNPTDSSPGAHPRFFTVNTPVGKPAEQQCGKAVHLDAHVTTVIPLFFRVFPDDCGSGFMAGEQTLAFMFFDLGSCIQDDSKPPPPPIVR
jgi:hypothetical protein